MGKTFQTGGLTNVIFYDTSGNVAINDTTASGYKLKVNGTLGVIGAATFSSSVTSTGYTATANTSGGFAGLTLANSGTGAAQILLNNSAQSWIVNLRTDNHFSIYNNTAATTPFFISTSGNVGIGTSSPSALLHLSSSSDASLFLNSGASAGSYLKYYANGNQQWFIGTNAAGNNIDYNIYGYSGSYSGNIVAFTQGTERMRITSGGDVLIGTTSNVGQRLRIYQPTSSQWNIKLVQPDGSSQLFQEFLTTTDGDATNTARGSIRYNGINVLYLGTSDYRLKEDLRDYNALSIVSKLKTYDFKWKESGTRDFGMMAHELQEVLPNYVTGVKDELNEDGTINPQQVDYSKLIPVLVKAIQELSAKVTALENK